MQKLFLFKRIQIKGIAIREPNDGAILPTLDQNSLANVGKIDLLSNPNFFGEILELEDTRKVLENEENERFWKLNDFNKITKVFVWKFLVQLFKRNPTIDGEIVVYFRDLDELFVGCNVNFFSVGDDTRNDFFFFGNGNFNEII